jgi:glycosyltransferase involved in cell wall biosynthesis
MLVRSGVHDLGTRPPRHVMFTYLGRRGLSRFTLELARCMSEMPHVQATFCVSRQNEIFGRFTELPCRVLPVDTFEGPAGALARSYRVRSLYRNMLGELRRWRSAGVISLMPHVWTPLIAPLIRNNGFRYLTVIHDAHPHPGDPTSLLNGWALRDALHADPVVTLSRSVADALAASGTVPRHKLAPLFHPDLDFGAAECAPPPPGAWPFRVLFFGRVLAYKGLPTLVEAIELLRADGLPVHLGVFGEGPLGALQARLQAIGAEVQNCWIADDEVGAILARHHAVALPHNECSQSGAAAAALGAGLPLVGCRIGGLAEQVRDGATGVLAQGSDAASLAAAIRRLAADRTLYAGIRAHIRTSAWERSMRRFAEHLVALATDASPLPLGLSPRELAWV